jgi:two-component system sensor histidine kinase QseC
MGFTVDDAFGAARSIDLVLARETAGLDAALDHLRRLLLVVGALTVSIAAAALCGIVALALRPLGALAAEIGALDPDDLSARVRARGVPHELRPVIERLNELLSRLEGAFHRERSFSANVAHELRTPLAGIRSTVEVALAGDQDKEDCAEALRDVLEIASEMQMMVEKLMAIARIEAGKVDVTLEDVSLNALVQACWQPLAERAASRGLRVAWGLADETQLTTDPQLVQTAVRNVLENAVAYTQEGGSIEVRTYGQEGGLELAVRNTGASLSGREAQLVFGRFWRGDSARSDAALHAGLGLPLAKRAIEAVGGTVTVECDDTFRIRLWLPLLCRAGQ